MMKKFLNYLLIVILSTTIYQNVCAQESNDSSAIILRTSVGKTSVKLRWAANNPLVWKKTLQSGFKIERYTDVRNRKLLPEKEKSVLTTQPVKPAPLENWEIPATQNQYAAIIAQAIYGDTFEVSGMQTPDVSTMINLTRDMEQRFTFSLYCADMSFEAALLAGWAFEDKDVKPGECYLYRVIPVDETGLPLDIQYGFSYCCMDESRELPAPLGVSAEFGDKTVMLYWNNELMKNYFSAYMIERSEDNKQFIPMDKPVTSISDEHAGLSMFLDSLLENNKMYYYRIRGISSFGETGPPSDTISGMGQEVLQFTPQIVRAQINDDGNAEVEWTFDEKGSDLIQSFTLKRAENSKGEYKALIKEIPKNQRIVFFKEPFPVNYLTITAEPIQGKSTQSFPYLLTMQDSIPPAPPTGLTAETDTSGIIRIRWNPNAEPGISGYRIYKSNLSGEELIAITDSILDQPVYTDSVNLNNLNQYVYYSVKALDKRYNQSEFSERLQVEKPLRVQPSSPVFTSYNVEPDGINLSWINCTDDICTRHLLYKVQYGSLDTVLVKTFEGKEISVYKDSIINENTSYIYTLTAQSKWGVESLSSIPLQVKSGIVNNSELINLFKYKWIAEKQQIELSWEAIKPEIIQTYRIYRSENDQPLSLWKETNALTAIDNQLKKGYSYRYLLQAVCVNGKVSAKKEINLNH